MSKNRPFSFYSLPGIVAVLVLLGVVVSPFLFSSSPSAPPSAPKGLSFSVIRSNDLARPWDYASYDFLDVNPFPQGKMWILGQGKASRECTCFLFDLEKHAVLGALQGARPVALNEDGTKVLCSTREPAVPVNQPKWKALFRPILTVLFPRKMRTFSHLGDDQESFWLVHTNGGRTQFLGKGYQMRGAGSTGQPSPSGRFWRIQTTRDDHLVFDLTQEKMHQFPPADSWQGAWWSQNEILYKTKNNDLEVFDVKTYRSRVVLRAQEVADFCRTNGLALDTLGSLQTLPVWNGESYDFYLAGNWRRPGNGQTWLLFLAKTNAPLGIISKDFDFKRLGRFNSRGTHYVYCGESEQTGDRSAVFVKELSSGRITEVEGAKAGTKAFSIPTFYRDKVIFVKDSAIWIANLNGTEKKRLFPPMPP